MEDNKNYLKTPSLLTCYAERSRLHSRIKKEMKKTPDKLDPTLINEYIDSLSQVEKWIAALSTQDKAKTKYRINKAAAIACVFTIILFVAAGVTEASGIRVWTSIANWDSNYLSINYSSKPKSKFPPDDCSHIGPDKNFIATNDPTEIYSFSSISEAKESFGVDIPLPDTLINFHIYKVAIVAFEPNTINHITAFYTNDMGAYCDIDLDTVNDSINSSTKTVVPSDEYETIYLNGNECYLSKADKTNYAIFNTEFYFVILKTNQEHTAFMELVNNTYSCLTGENIE